MKFIDAIKKNQIVLLVIKGNGNNTMLDLCKAYSDKGIGIIVASIPAKFVLEKLKKNNIDYSRILIIDCISEGKEQVKGKELKQVIYRKGPSALTDLALTVSQLLKSKKLNIVILDSISSLLIHNKDITLVRFLHDIVNKVRNSDKKLVLTILEKDIKGSLASVPLFCDAVVELE